MKSSIVPLAGLAVLALAAGAAFAAPPEYCALYAREYANQFAAAAGESPDSEPKIQDEAYYRCLNMDQNPPMPTSSAYSGMSVDKADQGGPLEPVPGATAAERGTSAPAAYAKATAPAEGKAAVPAAAPVAASPPQPAMPKTADNGPVKHSYTSGEQPWTPAWVKWCKDHYPHSFDQKDGTIMPFGATKRVLCK